MRQEFKTNLELVETWLDEAELQLDQKVEDLDEAQAKQQVRNIEIVRNNEESNKSCLVTVSEQLQNNEYSFVKELVSEFDRFGSHVATLQANATELAAQAESPEEKEAIMSTVVALNDRWRDVQTKSEQKTQVSDISDICFM